MTSVIRQAGRVSVVTPPTGDILTIAELHAHLRVDGPQDDLVIRACLAAAIGEIDSPHGWLGRSLLSRTLRLTLDEMPGEAIYLPGPPVSSISATSCGITYRDADNAWQTVATADYTSDLTAEPALIWPLESWPSDMVGGVDGVRVQYIAGYSTGAVIPQPIRQWLLMRTAELYRDREPSALGTNFAHLPHADRMLDAWRVYA